MSAWRLVNGTDGMRFASGLALPRWRGLARSNGLINRRCNFCIIIVESTVPLLASEDSGGEITVVSAASRRTPARCMPHTATKGSVM